MSAPTPMPQTMLLETFQLGAHLFPRLKMPVLGLILVAAVLSWLLEVVLAVPPSIIPFFLFILSALLEVSVYRLVALNEDPPALAIRLGPREYRYLGYYLILIMIGLMVLSLLGMLLGNLMLSGGSFGFVLYLSLAVFAYLYLFLRFLPALVAVAMDTPETMNTNLGAAWQLTRGRVRPILLASLMLMLPSWIINLVVSIVTHELAQGTGAIMLSIIPSLAILYVVETLMAILRMVYYRHLGTGSTGKQV